MAQATSTSSKPTPTVLIPELLSFSPHFLLDDIINIANDGVGRAVDAMEDFLNRWAETRLEREPDWDADKELEQGLVSFQTLLEFHTDIAFDFFEAWSLRNIFAVPSNLPLVAPHHAGLDFDQPPGKEAELLAEIDELWRKIEKQNQLKRLLTKALRASRRHARQADARLARLAVLQPDQLRTLHAIAGDVGALHARISARPPLVDDAHTHPLPLGPGKREWEIGKAGYLNWASTRLVREARKAGESARDAASVEEARGALSKEDLAAACEALERESS